MFTQEGVRPHANNKRRWLVLACLTLGLSLIVLDETVVNTAFPILTADLGLDAYETEWIDSAYALTFASLLIFFGQLADRYGRKKFFLIGVAVFILASLGVVLSDTSTGVILARALQGCGGAMILPTTLAIINTYYHGRDRAIAFTIWGGTIGGVAAVGPMVGAWLISSHSWHWAFAINVPLGLLVMVASYFCIPGSRSGAQGKGLDLTGAILITFALFSVVFAIIEGGRFGFSYQREPFTAGSMTWPTSFPPITLLFLAIGIVSFLAFLLVEKSRSKQGRHVTLNVALFRSRSFSAGNLVAFVVSLGEFGLLFTLPLFLELVGGYDLLQAGVILSAIALGALIAALTGSFVCHLMGAKRTLQLGLALEIIGIAGLGITLTSTSTGWEMAPWLIAYGVGIGYATGQLASIILSGVAGHDSSVAGAFQSTSRQLGAALGTAILGTTLVIGLGSAAETLEAKGVPTGQAQEISQELQDSGGESIPDLATEPGGVDLVQVATGTFTNASKSVTWVVVFTLSAGLLVSFWIPKNAAREKQAG